jgi:hypothetical protein
MTATWLRIVVTRYGGEGGDTAGKLAGKNCRHSPSVRKASRVDTLWVYTERALESADEEVDEAQIIDCGIFSAASIPAGLPIGADDALRIDGDEMTQVGQM